MKINNWKKIESIFPIVDNISAIRADIIHNPNVEDMLGLRNTPPIVYTAHISIYGVPQSVWLDIIVFPMGKNNKLHIGMAKHKKDCQIVTPIPKNNLKSPKTFLQFVKNTFDNSLHLVI